VNEEDNSFTEELGPRIRSARVSKAMTQQDPVTGSYLARNTVQTAVPGPPYGNDHPDVDMSRSRNPTEAATGRNPSCPGPERSGSSVLGDRRFLRPSS
jgi:hypothetical protein